MKHTLALSLFLLAAIPASAVVDEGTVTSVDGKGAFEVKTERGVLVLHAHADLMGDKLEFKTRRWPHLYKDIKPGDYVSFSWQRDAKTGKNIVESVGIKKRGG